MIDWWVLGASLSYFAIAWIAGYFVGRRRQRRLTLEGKTWEYDVAHQLGEIRGLLTAIQIAKGERNGGRR